MESHVFVGPGVSRTMLAVVTALCGAGDVAVADSSQHDFKVHLSHWKAGGIPLNSVSSNWSFSDSHSIDELQ